MDIFSRSPRKDRQYSVFDSLPFVAVPQGEKPVKLRGLDVHVAISGLYAETTQTMRFYNPNRRDLEGTLTFPLPDRAVVCGYALDVEGELIDGVVVPKQKARRILEAEERKGIDPGLMEQMQGNVYRTRIYPVPAGGTRTVRITYVSDLTVDNDEAAYHLPLRHATQIDAVSLRLEVKQAPVQPQIRGGLGNLSLKRWEDRWVAEARLAGGASAEDLQVRLPDLPDRFTTVEKTADGEVFFCISHRLTDQQSDDKVWVPRRIALAWDASGSQTGIERDLALLDELLAGWPQVKVDVLVFRDRIEEDVLSFAMGEVQRDALLDTLKILPYDGGTNLAALDFAAPTHPDVEAWFLFSDGMGTVETGLPGKADRPVFTVNSRAVCNSAYMEHIARDSGGVYINLLRMSPAAAVKVICRKTQPFKITEADGCRDLHIASESGRMAILGRLGQRQNTAYVRLSGPGAPADRVEMAAATTSAGPTIARAWAGFQARLMEIAGDEQNGKALVDLGRKYGLVTPGTSLLVLENIQQHLEYDVEPPASRPEMMAEYRRRRAEQKKEAKVREQEDLDHVAVLWQARVEWWQKDFHAELKKLQKKRKVAGETGERVMPQMAPRVSRITDMVLSAEPRARVRVMMAMEHAPMEEAAKPDSEPGAEGMPDAAIRIKPWSPDTPYLTAMKAVDNDRAYLVYLEQRALYADSPAFFMDCADYLFSFGFREYGLRVLSNLLEMGLDDAPLMRMAAWRLQEAGELHLAVAILERVLVQRDDEPQSHRDLALALADRWQKDGNHEDVIRAIALLYAVVRRPWERFPEIEIIALMELNRLIHFAGQKEIVPPEKIDPRLKHLMDLDVRINMSWDTDLTDVDLHVFEPTGEHAFYGHNLTEIGGLVSRDFTQGYGPEEYVLHKAVSGIYTIKAHYYGSSQQTISGACTVIVTVFTDFGRETEKKQVLTLRLDKPSDEVLVGEITIKGKGPVDW